MDWRTFELLWSSSGKTANNAPTITSFSASPTTITTAPTAVTLSWEVAGATSLSINDGVGTVTGSSVTINVSATTTFTLSATNGAGTSTRAVEVTLLAGGKLWGSYQVNTSFSVNNLNTTQRKLRDAIIHAHTNRRTSQMSNLWTLDHSSIYNWRWPASYLNPMGNALFRSGDPGLLDIADDMINFLLDKGITRSWVKWPTDQPLPQNNTTPWNGVPFTRTGGEEYESWSYYANKDESWFANDQGNYRRILYKKATGTEDSPHWGTDGTHALDEQLGHGLISFWMWVFEINRNRARTGNKNWGATADRLYSYFNAADGYWAKWANRPNMHIFLVIDGVVKDQGIRSKSRDSTTKIHNGTSNLAHPWFNLWRIYYYNNETRRARGDALNSNDTTAAPIALNRFIRDLAYATLPSAAATGLAIPISNPTQYQMMFWPHFINHAADGGHVMTYPSYLTGAMVDAMNVGAVDSQGLSLTRADMEKAANAVGFAWFRDKHTGTTRSGNVAGQYLSGTDPNYVHRLANHTSTNPSTYTTSIKGGGLSNTAFTGVTAGPLQFDPTAEKYTVKAYRWAMENTTLANRFILANILADHTHTSNTRWGPLLNFYNIALEQPSLDLANTAFPA